MNERLKVNFELSDETVCIQWNSPKGIDARNAMILAVLKDECQEDPTTDRLEKLKELWLIKT